MSTLRLSAKLPLLIVALVLAAELVLGIVAYTKSAGQLVAASEDKLLALSGARRTALETYLGILREDISNMAENAQMIEAALDFQYTLEFGDKAKGIAKIRKAYFEDNKEGAKLEKADGSRYSKSHARNHPVFRKFIERRGYQDLIMVDNTGIVVYTVQKGAEYATSLTDGEWKDSILAETYQAIAKEPKAGNLVFTDIRPYAPDGGAPGGFIAAPMMDGDQFLGVLLFRMPIGRINAILQEPTGLGETGESYIVGSDKLMRSDLRLQEAPTILKEQLDIPSVEAALAGGQGVMETEGFGGHSVVAAYAPVDFMGRKWAVIAEMDEDEVLAPVDETRTFMIVATIIITAIAIGVGVLISRSIAGAIANMTKATTDLAHGDLSVKVPYRKRVDEIGEMAGAVQVFKENAVKLKQVMAQQEVDSRRNQRRLKNEMMALTNALDEEVKAAIGIVLQQSEAMHQAAVEMGGAVSRSEGMAGAAASASTDASSSVDAVAAAAEQLSNSIHEISEQVSKSTAIAHKAVSEAEDTNTKILGLAEAANKIGEVVSLITDIAEQTNLLALNATIEAARAGDAGKGFAVVASEVKNLANQTAKATEEIGAQIGGIQGATQEAVGAIQGIGSIISEISEITTAIAAAVEEQSAATGNISNNAQQAAHSTQEASSNISDVSETTAQSGQHSREVQESAEEVRGRIVQMQGALEAIMRTSSGEDEHLSTLHTVNMAATLDIDGDNQTCLVQDISLSGVAVLDRKLPGERGAAFRMELPKIGTLSGVVVAQTENSTHIRLDIEEGDMERIEAFLGDRGGSA